ncbi:MAG: hypothetical protein AAFX10_16685 [Pseudomonadota bacterium]
MEFLLATCQTKKAAGQGGFEMAGIVPKNRAKKSTYHDFGRRSEMASGSDRK